MANNFINIDLTSNKRLAYKLRQAIDDFLKAESQLEALKSDMDQMINGTDYTTLEAEFALPAGKGDDVYNLVAGAVSELNADTNYQQLLSWLAATI